MTRHSIRQHGKSQLTRRIFLRRALLGSAALAGTLTLNRSTWWPVPIGRAAGTGIVGVIVDLLTDRPLAQATVIAAEAVVLTDDAGRFEISLPPGNHAVFVRASGHLDTSRTISVSEGSMTGTKMAMILSNPTSDEQEQIYAKIIREPEWPAADEAAIESLLSDSVQASATVPDSIWVQLSNGSVVQMDLDEYLRHVVPYEVPASWPTEALRAQAVAARTYAVARNPTQNNPICTDTRCQVYGPNTYQTTDEAVRSTHKQIATYNDAAITAFFFSRCNGHSTKNSEDAISWQNNCARLNWKYLAYCRSASCTGHAPSGMSSCGYYGHGVGMCQWGAYYLAQQGRSFLEILRNYYKDIQITRTAPQLSSPRDGHLQLASSALTFSWAGGSEQYQVTITGGGGTSTSGWIGTASYSPTLSAGTYTWYVTGRSGVTTDGQSATWRFTLANSLYNKGLSGVRKNSS